MAMFIKAYAEPASGRNGVNGRAANGQSLRRRRGETMGQYYRRTGEAVVGATSRTRGRVATVRPVRGR